MSQQGQGENRGGTYDLVWIIVGITIICILIWIVAQEYLKIFFINVRYAQFWVLNVILGWNKNFAYLNDYLNFIQDLSPNTLSKSVVADLSYTMGIYYRWPCGLLLIYLSYLVYIRDVTTRYCKTYTMQDLSKQEWHNWPHIKPVISLDLVKTDLDQGPWAMAKSPVLFVRSHRLIKIEKKIAITLSEKDLYQPILNKNRAQGIFTAQLGKVFTKIEHMALHKRALFSIFVGRICRDTESSRDLVTKIGSSYNNGKVDLTGADILWKKHINHPLIKELINSHAYESTLLCSALQLAREDGVLPVAELIWLKPIDRVLWYALGSVGRQVAFCECAGIFAHWKAECRLRRALAVPIVDLAVVALEKALGDIIYKPTQEELDKLCAE